MATTTVADALKRAETILMDDTNVRWPRDELLMWFNDAVMAVVNLRPDANTKNEPFVCVRGTKQALPADALRLINVRRNLPGKVIRAIPEQVLNDQLPDWHEDDGVQAAAQHFVYDDRDPKRFYLYPGIEAGASVEIVYSFAPTAVTIDQVDSVETPATLPIDDGFLNALVDFILYRAYSKDAQYAANLDRAQMHYRAFADALQAKSSSDAAISPRAG